MLVDVFLLSGMTLRTAHTARTARTGQSGKTLLSRITSLKDSDNFQYHPAAINSLEPRVARRSGLSSSSRSTVEEEAKSIPKDTIVPALMISLCCFNNTVSGWLYEFKGYHKLRLQFVKLPLNCPKLTMEKVLPATQWPTRFATSLSLGYSSSFSRSTMDGTLPWVSVWLNRLEICLRLF